MLCADSLEDRTFLFAAEALQGISAQNIYIIYAGKFIPSSFHLNSCLRFAIRVQEGTTFSASCNARMLYGGCLERGLDEMTRGFFKSSRIKLVIHKKFGKHVRRFQGNIASPFYGLSNIATIRL